MKETHEYLVPDYYPHFACKMGACRLACCVGWPISLSMKDYFSLLGVACSKPLRDKLDCAMHLVERPTQERYAQINPRFDGDCPLRMPDGRCMVHVELGEEALSGVCRLYPRAPRSEGDYECSCANSCEGVLELMFTMDAPMGFHKEALTFELEKEQGRTVFFETVGREQEIRLYLIKKVQDRSLPMPERLMAFGRALWAVETALDAKDEKAVDALLRGADIPSTPYDEQTQGAQLQDGLIIARRMVDLLDERSPSIHAYGEKALGYFGEGEGVLERYQRAREHFEKALPKWPIYIEHMLVNHMFFVRFPFQDRPESLGDEFLALCSVYTLLRFLGIGCMADRDDLTDFVDLAAAAFRLIDHTSFDRYAGHILRELGCTTPSRIHDLISL